MDIETLAQIETNLTKEGLLMFKDYTNTYDTLELFWLNFQDTQKKYNTCFLDGSHQTLSNGFARSLKDTLCICKYYYECSLLEFLQTIAKHNIVSHWCPDISYFCIAAEKERPGWGFQNPDRYCPEFLDYTFNQMLNFAKEY